jgi:hypothetical protein
MSQAGIASIAGLIGTPITVPNGGTGVTSFIPYAVITGGVTSTSPLQSVASVGTAGQVLTSNGAGTLPTFQTNASGDVVGPAAATDNAVARFDGATGKLIQNSVVIISDLGDIFTPTVVNIGTAAPTNVQELSIQSSVAGTIGTYIFNTNATGGSRQAIVTNGTGDTWILFSIFSVTDWSIGLDNSDSDKFKISANATLGTADALTIDPGTLAVTIPNLFNPGSGQAVKFTVPGAYPYNVLTTDYIVNVDTSIARTIRLPNAPTSGQVFIIKDVTGSAGANNISLTTVGGAVTIDGATTQTMNVNYGSLTVFFNGTSYFIT